MQVLYDRVKKLWFSEQDKSGGSALG